MAKGNPFYNYFHCQEAEELFRKCLQHKLLSTYIGGDRVVITTPSKDVVAIVMSERRDNSKCEYEHIIHCSQDRGQTPGGKCYTAPCVLQAILTCATRM